MTTETVGTARSSAALPERAYRLLVTVARGTPTTEAENLVRTAATIARERDGALVVASLAVVPRQTPLDALSTDDPPVREGNTQAAELIETAVPEGVPAAGVVRLGHAEAGSILHLVDEHGCDGVAMHVDPKGSQRRRLLAGDAVERVVSRADCDVFVAKRGSAATPIDRVLLPASGGPHADIAAGTARALGRETNARVDVVHFLGTEASRREREAAEDVVETVRKAVEGVTHAETAVTVADDPATAIVDRSDDYDVTVLGAPTSGLLRQFVFGTVPDRVNRGSENAVVMARSNVGRRSAYDRWIGGDPNRA